MSETTVEQKQEYACPQCGKSDGFYETLMVEGWEAVDEFLERTGERDVDWFHVHHDDSYGCSCGWAPRMKSALAKVAPNGIDGEPLPEIHPDQLELPL